MGGVVVGGTVVGGTVLAEVLELVLGRVVDETPVVPVPGDVVDELLAGVVVDEFGELVDVEGTGPVDGGGNDSSHTTSVMRKRPALATPPIVA